MPARIYFPQPPANVPPPGGDQDKAPLLRAIIGAELGVCSLVMAARFYTRLRLVRNAGADDWIMLVTYLCALIGTFLDFVGMDYGVGRHVYYLGHEHSIKAMRFDWLAQSFLIPGVTTGKISFAFFILRLSNTKWHTFFLQTVNATLIIIDIPLIILTFAQCKPAALLWDPSLHGYCWDPTQVGALALFQGSYGAVTSLIYALFPLLILWNLQVPLKRKFALGSLMCLGVFSAFAGSVKTYFLQRLNSRADFTYDGTSLLIWATTEMYVIIFAGCLPTLRPLALKAVSMFKGHPPCQNGYMLYQQTNEGNSRALRPYNIENNHQRCVMPSGKSDSDQQFLPPGIIKTTEIAIDYDSKKSETNKKRMYWESHGDDSIEVTHAVGAVERV